MFGPVLGLFSELGKSTYWWGRDNARVDFVLGSALVFAGWAVLGAYRVMCQELQVRTTPWAWLVFSLFLTRAARGPERAAADEFCYCFGAVALPDTRASGSPGGD